MVSGVRFQVSDKKLQHHETLGPKIIYDVECRVDIFDFDTYASFLTPDT